MMKRILTLSILVCLMPMMAHAWVLNTWVKTAGGSIQVGSGTPQTSVNGSVNTTYKTNTALTVAVAASTGYTLSQVTYNGVVQTAPIPISYQVNGPSNQSVLASFTPKTYVLSAAVAGNSGGTANMTSISYLYGTKLTVAKKVTFTPTSASFQVASISGVPSGSTVSVAMPAAAGAPVTVTLPVGFTITDNIPLVATFTNTYPVAAAGAAQTVALGPVTLDGSGTLVGGGISSYQWTQVSGPVVALANATAAKASFTATDAGTYTFSLKVMPGGSTSTTTVTVSASAADVVQVKCNNCHTSSGSTTTTAAYTEWSTSKHEATYILCANCHIGADSGGHPGTISSNICISCHSADLGGSPAVAVGHNGIADTNATTCYNCHKHYLLSGGSLSCVSCHTDPPKAGQYYTGVTKYTHASSSTCVNCHVKPATYNDSATPTHRDGIVEILTNANACSVCHSYPPAGSSHLTAVGGNAPNCANCHTYTGFNGATHNNGNVELKPMTCTSCHDYPPAVLTVALSGKTGQHSSSTDCAMCHGYLPTSNAASGLHRNGTVNLLKSGAPHFSNITTGMFPASYVTSKATCADCHNSNTNNATIRQQWAASGHASTTGLPWIDYDFKTRTPCERCHTTTGFIAYSTAKVTAVWGTASDKTKEVLTCVGCHSDVANGIVRTVTPNNPYASDVSFTGNVNVGTSNICMDCHTGMNNGADIQIKVGTANFTNLSFVSPHYLTAGGSLQGKSGYIFPARTYNGYSDNAHSKVGTADSNATGTAGPCVACHMATTAEKHSFTPITTDGSGTITAITANVCANCHTYNTTSLTPTTLDAKRVAFTNSLEVLRIALVDKGFTYSPNYPYFAAKNWGTGQAGANVMGAAFNYKLFAAEPGAYAHNPGYAKQLIADSIEAVATGGSVTGSDISAYLNSLVAANKLTSEQVSGLDTYKNPTNSCSDCHGAPPATSVHATATTSPLNCTNCHIYTGMGGATHNNGTVNLSVLTCTSCHPNLSSSHAAHVGNLPTLVTAYNSTDTYFNSNSTDSTGYRFGCATCHPTTNASHYNGTIVLNSFNGAAGTSKSNITCSAAVCHADGKGANVTSPNWYTGFTGADRCAMCHAAKPTTGSHAAHTAVNGIHDGSSGISYADTVTCANCHAGTVDSAKNINYVNHVNGSVSVSFATTNVVSKAQISAASFNAYSTVWTRTGATDTSKLALSAGSYAGGTCSTIACHNNGTTPAWGSGPLSCVACHSNL